MREAKCHRCGTLGFWITRAYPGGKPLCTLCLKKQVAS